MKSRGLEGGMEVRRRCVGPSCSDCMDEAFKGQKGASYHDLQYWIRALVLHVLEKKSTVSPSATHVHVFKMGTFSFSQVLGANNANLSSTPLHPFPITYPTSPNIPSGICVQHVLLDVETSTGTWTTYLILTLKGNWLSFPKKTSTIKIVYCCVEKLVIKYKSDLCLTLKDNPRKQYI